MHAPCPTVSIGLPVYNGERYLGPALESMLAQSFTDFELIISDNASTDATEGICRVYAARDPRIRYVRQARNMGAHYNHNHVFSLARGRYFKWAGHDDMLAPDFLLRCVEILHQEARMVLCATGVTTIDASGGVMRQEAFCEGFDAPRPHERLRSFFGRNYAYYIIYGLMRRAVLQRTGLHQSWYGSDRALLTEMSLYGGFYSIKERLLLIREHPHRSAYVADKITWFTPQLHDCFLPEYWQRIANSIRMVRQLPVSSQERYLCLLAFGWRACQRYQHWLPRLVLEAVHMTQQAFRPERGK